VLEENLEHKLIVLSLNARYSKCAINPRNWPILYMYSFPSLKAHKYLPWGCVCSSKF